MGAVYEALDQRVSSVVALKETLVGSDPEAHRAFEREAALLANLRHAALPKVMDYFSENDGEFLVMEYIAGTDLAALLTAHNNPFSELQVLRWADAVLALLDYLHTREPPILHRDIKPSNLKVNPEGEIFLLDFGLAKGAAGQMPTLGMSLSVRGFTPAYAPIEQITGRGTEPRSDLYSLGGTLYHLLTAQAPLDAPTRFEAIDDGRPDPQPPLANLNPRVSALTASIVAQAMAVSRRDRPASAREMRQKLSEAASKIQEAGEAETLVGEIWPVTLAQASAIEPSPTSHSVDPPKPTPTVRAVPLSGESPPVKTLAVNHLLIDQNTAKRITTEPLSVAGPPQINRAGSWAVGTVVALMVLAAVGIIVWLSLTNYRSTAQAPADGQSNSQSLASTNTPDNQSRVIGQQNQNQQAPIVASPSPTPTPTTGSISGRASDSNGAAIPGTSVSATRVADAKSFNKVTNDDGRFSFPSLPAGIYTVRFQAPGFSVSIYQNIKVGGSPARVNATLQVGSEAITIQHRGR